LKPGAAAEKNSRGFWVLTLEVDEDFVVVVRGRCCFGFVFIGNSCSNYVLLFFRTQGFYFAQQSPSTGTYNCMKSIGLPESRKEYSPYFYMITGQ